MITIVDYGSGNINAITNVYDLLKVPYAIASKPEELDNADKIILPGVGSFDYCMNKLNGSGLKEVLNKKVLEEGKSVFGICIGLHLMMEGSEEGVLRGLGWIKGNVKKFDVNKLEHKPKIPHMGWNSVEVKSNFKLFSEVENEIGFYFIHSYYVEVEDKNVVMTTTNYEEEFVSGVHQNNISAVQFHPEKSHSNGMKLLKNFSEL